MTNAPPPLYLIDGSGFIFRAFHALPPLTRSDGVPIGAVMGFCNMLTKLLNDHPGAAVAVIFDAARRNFRNDIYPDYKANRSETPPDLIPQFPLMRDATKAFGLEGIEIDGYEADDIIATYARLARDEGREVTIVSSDKDLMQLVRDGVRMLDPIKQTAIGPDQVFEKFGVAPDRVVDVQALAGDSVDNVPGVPGIGVKTAAQLITEYGDLETLLARAGEIKQPKRREALVEHAEMARISKKLVALDAFAPVTIPVRDLILRVDDTEKLKSFFVTMGFKTLLARLGMAAPEPAVVARPAAAPIAVVTPSDIKQDYRLITATDDLHAVIAMARETGKLAVDTETTNLTPARADLVGISLCPRPGTAFYIPLGHGGKKDLFDMGASDAPDQLPVDTVMEILKPVLEDETVLKIGHNLKYDWQMFSRHGVHIAPADDTMLMSYLLDGTLHGHGLDELAKLLCGHDMISYDSMTGTGKSRITFDQVPVDKAKDYAAEDADFTQRIHDALSPRIPAEKMAAVYQDIERPLVPVIATMEENGIRVDKPFLHKLSHDFSIKIAEIEKEIHAEAGTAFNIASPKQLGVILFDQMGLPGGSKTKTGDWSTAADVLEDLAAQGYPFVEKILRFRQMSKLKSTYTDALQEQINPATGRVHTSFSMAGTNTGRLSSSDPNLQNIPIRTEEGRQIRKAFIAEEGQVLISADYSQIELRLVAEMADIPALKKAFQDGIDIHTATASQVFGVPIDQMTPDVRRKAKAINFGIIYGISGFGLAKQLDVEPGEASQYIKAYFARFPELAAYMERAKAEARASGYVKTLWGRKVMIHGIADKIHGRRAAAERQAINAPVQGTAADLMKLAMIRLHSKIKNEKLPLRMLLQVHDELVFETPKDQAEAMIPVIREVMENVATFSVPLIVEAGVGLNWADAH